MTTAGQINQVIAVAMIKHLPPSASTLRLLDVSGSLGTSLSTLRSDLAVITAEADDLDAIAAYDVALADDHLRRWLALLRPGGRLIAVDPQGEASADLVKRLETAGYTRILVEELLPNGVLLRGEKPHVTRDTLARIRSVAALDLSQPEFKGRYVHLLIRQTPNKPIWALKPDARIEWQAAALVEGDQPLLLAFSSLPNAVAFMQPAVIAGSVKDVHKVAKFSRTAAEHWHLLINPPVAVLRGRAIVFVPIDPALAETPDE